MTPSENPIPAALPPCPVHAQPSKWLCGFCGQPVCPACKPIAFDYKVFHPACIEKYRHEPERKPARVWSGDAPSTGVKIIAWGFLIGAVLLLGLASVALGVALFSRHYVPVTNWMGNPLPVLDDIPGSRVLIGWLAVLGYFGAAAQVLIGLGLLNCIPAARRAVLTLSWCEIVIAVIGWIVVLVAQQGFWDIPVFAAGLIVFFSRRSVKQQFQAPAGPPAPGPPAT